MACQIPLNSGKFFIITIVISGIISAQPILADSGESDNQEPARV